MSISGNNGFKTGYGLTQALTTLASQPIVAKRAPLSQDIGAQLGQLWIYPAINGVWVLTSIVNNLATWSDISGGAGSFTSLTINPGPTNLSTVGNGNVSIGNATNTGAVTLTAGTGNLAINGAGNIISIANDAAANSLILGTLTAAGTTLIEGGTGTGVGTAAITMLSGTTGDIQIGSVAHTGALYLGVSTAGDTVNVASAINTGAQMVNIANGASGANSTVNILSGVGTAGAGVLALGNNTRVTTIGLGNIAPAAARTITIAGGNSAQNDTVNILDGNPSANAQTVSILSGTPTGGTQVLNLGNQTTHAIGINIGSGTGAATVAIANGAAANTVNIATGAAAQSVTVGSTNTSSFLTLQAGSGGLSLKGGQILPIKNVNNAATPYTLLTTDQFVAVDPTAGVVSITLPAVPVTGRFITVYDATGQAAAHTITIDGNGNNISAGGTSAATKTLTTAYQSMNLWFNGTIWNGQLIT